MPGEQLPGSFQQRVERAAEAAMEQNGSVGPLELLQFMGFLQPVHVEGWRKGNECYPFLQQWIQVGPEKFQKALRHFEEWVKQRGLRPIQAAYTRRGPAGLEELRVTENRDPKWEKFFRTHYAPADIPAKASERLEAKLKRPPELVVFEKVSEEGNCAECGVELLKGDYLLIEKGRPVCVACGDLDDLVFLPAGDTALTRRARKNSRVAAVVVRFNRSRRRYERQGLLVTESAFSRAEAECAADAPERAVARARAAVARQEEDRDFISALASAIAQRYPGCPPDDALQVAQHTGLRGSGRVGRSAAGRELDPLAIDRSVTAHIRHAHTNYDTLLMSGVERLEARALVRGKIDAVLEKWRA
jgi:hypothetical protein